MTPVFTGKLEGEDLGREKTLGSEGLLKLSQRGLSSWNSNVGKKKQEDFSVPTASVPLALQTDAG